MQLHRQHGLLKTFQEAAFLVHKLLNGFAVSLEIVNPAQTDQHRRERDLVVERLAEFTGTSEIPYQLIRPKPSARR
jgi:hypothetical protein